MEIQKESIQITILSGQVETSIGGLASSYDSDWYVNVLLTKDIELTDYVEVSKDSYQLTIDRQSINPYFYELGFFETISSISYDTDNINFWSNLVNLSSVQDSEDPVLYNTLFKIMSGSIELKSNIFNIQLQPPVSAATTNSIQVIVNKMSDIKQVTDNNQISFAKSNITS